MTTRATYSLHTSMNTSVMITEIALFSVQHSLLNFVRLLPCLHWPGEARSKTMKIWPTNGQIQPLGDFQNLRLGRVQSGQNRHFRDQGSNYIDRLRSIFLQPARTSASNEHPDTQMRFLSGFQFFFENLSGYGNWVVFGQILMRQRKWVDDDIISKF